MIASRRATAPARRATAAAVAAAAPSPASGYKPLHITYLLPSSTTDRIKAIFILSLQRQYKFFMLFLLLRYCTRVRGVLIVRSRPMAFVIKYHILVMVGIVLHSNFFMTFQEHLLTFHKSIILSRTCRVYYDFFIDTAMPFGLVSILLQAKTLQ